MYYLRSRAAADAIKFTVDTSVLQVMTRDNHYFFHQFFFLCFSERDSHLWAIQDKKLKADGAAAAAADDDDTKMAQMVCSLANRDDCLACGSWEKMWFRFRFFLMLEDLKGFWYGGWATAVRCCFEGFYLWVKSNPVQLYRYIYIHVTFNVCIG